MSVRDRVDYPAVLLALSGLLFCVPLADVWRDAVVAGETLPSTLLENAVVFLLSGAFVWSSVWLVRSDRDERYTRTVARWSIVGTACVALAYAWVVGFQLFTQSSLKPYIIAADGVVIGGLVLFVAGVYNARSERERAARAAERDRFSALFDNTSDAVLAVGSASDEPEIRAVNDPFERVFGTEGSAVVGRSVVDALADRADPEDANGRAPGDSPAARLRAVSGDPTEQAELRLRTADGARDYLVEYVPVGDETERSDGTAGFLMLTDITSQRTRERQFETLSEGAGGLLGARSMEGVTGALRTLVGDLFDGVLVGVWRYDPDDDAYRPLATARGGSDDLRAAAVPAVPAADPDGAAGEAVGSAADGGLPAFDAAALTDALSAGRFDARETVVEELPSPYRLTLSRSRDLSNTERHLIDLFVANAQAAIRRVDREETLARRNDQLEFVNSLLRHDIQNSMTVIRARGEALAESLDDREADYARTVVDQSDDVIELVDQFRVLLDALTDRGDGNTKPVSLSSTLEDRVATLKTTYPEAAVTADVPDGVAVEADEMLGSVLGNVLDNAVEHNDGDDPSVTVSVTEGERRAVVRIADDGPGVPEPERETIFRRGDRGLKESDIGSGFGLFFVDTMMEKYGGEVTVGDNDPGGAVFELSFRKSDGAEPPEATDAA